MEQETDGRPTLRRRAALIVISASVVLLGVTAAAVVLLERLQDAQERVVQDYFAAIQATNRQFVEYVDAGAAVRGYMLTGDPGILEPFEAIRQSQDGETLALVESMFGADSAQAAQLRATLGAAQLWVEGWAEPTVERVRVEGPRPVEPAEIAAGRELFDTVRTGYADFRDSLLTGRIGAQAALELRTQLLFAAVIVLAIATAIVAIALWYLTRRWVIGPIDEIAAETRIVSQGDLEHDVSSTGPLEFVHLAADVDAMRQRLVQQIGVIEAANQHARVVQAELQERTDALQRSNRDLEQFAYVASHDLQEPLRKVASFCQMLQRRYEGQLDERADQYIAFAVDGATRMQRLINDLLAFSRVGRVGVPDVDVDLDECMRRVVDNLSAAQEESGAQITWDALPTVRGDQTLLIRLLQNLISNAIKFRGSEPPVVHIGAEPAEGGWEFWCADNGMGIDAEYANRVFVIFQRLHPKEAYEGTGIGLAICKRIVEHHGGQIWVDASVDAGTTIRWTLPTKVAAEQGVADDR